MEYTRYINEYYPKSTKVGELPSFKQDRVKEIKQMSEVNVEVDERMTKQSVKVIKVTKAKLTESEDGKGWNFNAKATLRLLE